MFKLWVESLSLSTSLLMKSSDFSQIEPGLASLLPRLWGEFSGVITTGFISLRDYQLHQPALPIMWSVESNNFIIDVQRFKQFSKPTRTFSLLKAPCNGTRNTRPKTLLIQVQRCKCLFSPILYIDVTIVEPHYDGLTRQMAHITGHSYQC